MVITKHTEDFVRLCVEKFYRESDDEFNRLNSLTKFNPEKLDDLSPESREYIFKMYETIEENVVKILFRIECCDDAEIPKSHAIANIIDKTIGSNYCGKRPSDDQIHEIVNNHSVEE